VTSLCAKYEIKEGKNETEKLKKFFFGEQSDTSESIF
jgi:hypothetical protein